jgi:hypothetical protein
MMMRRSNRSLFFLFLFFVTGCLLSSCVYHDTQPDPVDPVDPVPIIACDTISWHEHVLPIMISSCAISSCHDGISMLDWRDYDQVVLYDLQIRANTLNGSMPPDTQLTKLQIKTIECWVTSGSPEN